MLTIMRQLLRSKAAGFLFVILIVSMAAWGVTDVFGGSLANKMISAGDRSVSSEQFDATVERQLRLMTDDRGRSMLKEQALERGVIDQLLQSEQFSLALSAYGDRIGITVTNENIKNRILSMEGFLDSTGLFDPARYDRILRDNGYTPSTFEAAIESELTEIRLRQLPEAALFIPDTLAEPTARYSAEARAAEWFILSQSQLPALPDPTDAELEILYNNVQTSLREPERRDVSLLKIGVDDFTSQANIQDADIRSFYDAYRRERYVGPDTRAYTLYNFESEAVARAALGQIAGGAADTDIAGLTLATEVTGRAESISNERLQSQVFSPAALENSIHGPVLDNGSWVIARIERIIEGDAVPYEDVRDAIADELARELAVDLFYDALPRLDDLIGTGASLETIGQDLGIPVLMYSQIDQQGLNATSQPVAAMQESPELLDIIFASSEGTTTERVGNDDIIWMARIDAITPERMPAPDEVRDVLVTAWTQEQASNQVLTKANELKLKIEAGELSFTEAAAGLNAEISQMATARTRTAARDILPPALISALFEAGDVGRVATLSAGSTDILIMRVKDVETPTSEDIDSLLQQTKISLQEQVANDLFQAYFGSIQSEVEFQVNPAAIEAYKQSITPSL